MIQITTFYLENGTFLNIEIRKQGYNSTFFTGFGMMVQMAASNTVLQTIADDAKRGRVMSFYTVAFVGMTPFGSLLAGWLASRLGAKETVLISGICCLLGAVVFLGRLQALREMLSPIYEKKGIMLKGKIF